MLSYYIWTVQVHLGAPCFWGTCLQWGHPGHNLGRWGGMILFPLCLNGDVLLSNYNVRERLTWCIHICLNLCCIKRPVFKYIVNVIFIINIFSIINNIIVILSVVVIIFIVTGVIIIKILVISIYIKKHKKNTNNTKQLTFKELTVKQSTVYKTTLQ